MESRKLEDPERQIRYTIDPTKSYHNLLQKEEETAVQTFLWDGNVAGMWEDTGASAERTAGRSADNAASRYYLQDELGSPIRLLGEGGGLEESYGYDEFGQDLYGNQGLLQPFGYTGYQADRTAGTYYAQAREYRAELGRFAAADIVKGFLMAPFTLNEYGYCWNNPEEYVDLDGAWPTREKRENRKKERKERRDVWTLKNDKQGREILWHYLYGKGEELTYVDGEWGEYMKNNQLLKEKVAGIVLPYADDLNAGESKEINITTPMEIENGEGIIGYQYLHGTNSDVGDFQIIGNISKDSNGGIIYDLSYTWNVNGR